jgi:hypothetical protein
VTFYRTTLNDAATDYNPGANLDDARATVVLTDPPARPVAASPPGVLTPTGVPT